VTDAETALGNLLGEGVFQPRDFALTLEHFRTAAVLDGESGRVVPAVLQIFESGEEFVYCAVVVTADSGDNSTHQQYTPVVSVVRVVLVTVIVRGSKFESRSGRRGDRRIIRAYRSFGLLHRALYRPDRPDVREAGDVRQIATGALCYTLADCPVGGNTASVGPTYLETNGIVPGAYYRSRDALAAREPSAGREIGPVAHTYVAASRW
jgi:hypothetical protein